MNLDLEKRVPREILAELIEEGTEAFRGILEKLFNVAMQLERSEFLGAEAYERTASRRGYRNGFKGKRIQTRVGELHLEIPQVRGLRFYPKSLERGCRSEKALKLAIAEMYVMGVSTRKVTEITEQLCGLDKLSRPPRSREWPGCWTKSWKSFEAGSWESIRSCIWMPTTRRFEEAAGCRTWPS